MFNALQKRGWTGPALVQHPSDWYYVGEAWCFTRDNRTLNLYFVADLGTGFHVPGTIESVACRLDGDQSEYDLWLERTRNTKWKASVVRWAEELSARRRFGPAVS